MASAGILLLSNIFYDLAFIRGINTFQSTAEGMKKILQYRMSAKRITSVAGRTAAPPLSLIAGTYCKG
eukprot:97150-Amorphochlora_amoeboformis.AAC.2